MNQIIDLKEMTDFNLNNAIDYTRKEIKASEEALEILEKERRLRYTTKSKKLM